MQVGGSRNTGKLLMDRSSPGRMGVVPPTLDVPLQILPDDSMLRSELDLPEISEPEVVQYFTNLSQLNFSIDTHFYPLGSCTMKYNPKINDEVSFMAGFAGIHPRQPLETCQGALEVLYRLQEFLAKGYRDGRCKSRYLGRCSRGTCWCVDDESLSHVARGPS
ncbi:MAG: hypothetical protein Ct9H300mP27_08810 [Chloroflexota bacterium]|nr:MAG: hypothetical protein Ct9H300mP27_08810 [Chloroflexota bacterium]